MIEKKVYNGWAFKENEREKAAVNMEIYKELNEKYRILQAFGEEYSEENYDLIYQREPGYNHALYEMLKNDTDMTRDELLLVFDGGNLCFGGSYQGGPKFRVSED